MAEQKKQSFLHGAALLAMATAIVKVIGALYKIPLNAIIGKQGFGYYSTAYEIYAVLLMISTAGLPVAAAILTAKYAAESDSISRAAILRRIRNVTLGAFVLLGLLGSLCMFFGAPLFAFLQGAQNAASSIAVIAPALLFICITSALRGWYQGLECQMPTAISQVAEAVGKLLCGLGFAAQVLESYKNAVKSLGFDEEQAVSITATTFSNAALFSPFSERSPTVLTPASAAACTVSHTPCVPPLRTLKGAAGSKGSGNHFSFCGIANGFHAGAYI